MLKTLSVRLAVAGALTLFGSSAMAVALDTSSATNGLTAIFSTTFAGGLPACTGSSPSYCSFFGGLPSAGQLAAVSIAPNPTGVTANTPAGILGAGAGSFLNLTSDGITSTLAGGTVTFGNGVITIVPAATNVTVTNAGMVFSSAPQVAAVTGLTSEFLVNLAPSLAVDFSTLAGGAVTGCSGPGCAALGSLSLDMVRYRLFVQWDPTFTSFTSSFIGQTGNNAMVYANLNSAVVPVPAAVWFMGSALGLLGLARRKLVA